MTISRRVLLATSLLGTLGASAGYAPALRPLEPGSFANLVGARRGQPFLLVLWSITCVPCRDEFALLRAIRTKHPGLPLVIVSTDDIADADLAARGLQDFGMDGEENWIFAADAQVLRYEIDPDWYGELPRAYFYDAGHRRDGISGRLPRSRIERWLAETQPAG